MTTKVNPVTYAADMKTHIELLAGDLKDLYIQDGCTQEYMEVTLTLLRKMYKYILLGEKQSERMGGVCAWRLRKSVIFYEFDINSRF